MIFSDSFFYHIIIQIQKKTKTRNWTQYRFRLKCWNNRVHNSHKQLNKMQRPAIYINILLMQVKVPNEMHNIYVRMGYVVSCKTSLIFWNWNTQNIIMSGCIQPSKNKSTEGCLKLKSPETRQVQEILVSTLEHLQVPKWDRTRCPEK